MNRRNFLVRSTAIGGLFWVYAQQTFGAENHSGKEKKNKKTSEFELGFIGKEPEYENFQNLLKGLVSVPIVRISPGKAIKQNFQALFLSKSCRHPEKILNRLLRSGKPVLWQLPENIGKLNTERILRTVTSGENLIEIFQPELYGRNILKARELISSNGSVIKNILLQWNVKPESDENVKAIGLAGIASMVHFLCGKWPGKVSTERPGESIRKENPSAFFFTFRYDGFFLQGTTVKSYFSKDPGWTMVIQTTREELTIHQEGNLLLQIPGKEKNMLVQTEKSDLLLGTRLQIEDFVKQLKAKKKDFDGMESLLWIIEIEKSIMESLKIGKEIQLEQIDFRKL